jgi:hypothetical protein
MDVNAESLRAQLMARDPMQRMLALHALQQQAQQRAPRMLGEVERFASRGIPFYAPQDAHYLGWVQRAVGYWERTQQQASATRG